MRSMRPLALTGTLGLAFLGLVMLSGLLGSQALTFSAAIAASSRWAKMGGS